MLTAISLRLLPLLTLLINASHQSLCQCHRPILRSYFHVHLIARISRSSGQDSNQTHIPITLYVMLERGARNFLRCVLHAGCCTLFSTFTTSNLCVVIHKDAQKISIHTYHTILSIFRPPPATPSSPLSFRLHLPLYIRITCVTLMCHHSMKHMFSGALIDKCVTVVGYLMTGT